MSGLASYIHDQLFEDWRDNRATLEDKWQRNIDAFRSISNGQWKKDEGTEWRSDAFIDFTRSKVIAGYALVIDMMLSGGKLPFMLKVSPRDEESYNDMDDESRSQIDEILQEMNSYIEQQLSDCNADRQLMKNILSEAIYGETYAKKIVHSVPAEYYVEGEQGFEYVYEETLSPGWEFVSVWDIFRDLETEDIKGGAGIIHRQMVSPYWLRQRMDQALFVNEAIQKVLSEHASVDTQRDTSLPPVLRDLPNRKNNLEYLEFWGRVPANIVEAYEKDMGESVEINDHDEGREGDEIEVMACVVNDEVVRFTRSDPRERPFYRAVWEIGIDDVGANGVADNVESTQGILNGVVRAIDDNTRLNANQMIAVKERYLDGDFELKPGAKIPIADECDDVRRAIMPVQMPDVCTPLYNYLTVIERLLDESSGVPKIAQGQAPTANRTDTATEINEQLEKSGKYIGATIRNNDEGLIEPMISDFYHYNMMDPECPCKGNFVVQALGFSSFQARVERLRKLNQLLTLMLSSEELGQYAKIEEMLKEMVKALDMDPDQILKSTEELAEEAQQPNPAVELEMADKQADIQHKQAETKAREAGIQFDAEKLKIEKARLIKDIELAGKSRLGEGVPLTSENRSNNQGPYRERGMTSNNVHPVAS